MEGASVSADCGFRRESVSNLTGRGVAGGQLVASFDWGPNSADFSDTVHCML